MKILIIGSCGFIGSNAVKYFSLHKNNEVFECDVIQKQQQNYFVIENAQHDFNKIFAQHNFDVCINCSGLANVQVSFQKPDLDFELNTLNLFLILNSIKNNNPNCKFINFSSAAVYGNPAKLPISESDAVKPLSPYGQHKYYSEQICKEFHTFFGVPTCSLRVFSAYGERLTKQLFWDLYQKQKLTPIVNLFGTGTETRDFIYIQDLLFAVDCVINNALFSGECINLASGIEIKIAEIANMFVQNFSKQNQIVFTGEIKIGDPQNWCADISYLKNLGFTTKVSMQEGLSNYAKWIKEME